METNNIVENNKLIAEFLEWKTRKGVEVSYKQYFIKLSWQDAPNNHEWVGKHSLRFERDWNWLMEVVEKIENTTPHSVIISCGNCEIFDCEYQETTVFKEGVKISAVYSAVVEFIIYYNNKNKAI